MDGTTISFYDKGGQTFEVPSHAIKIPRTRQANKYGYNNRSVSRSEWDEPRDKEAGEAKRGKKRKWEEFVADA
jgi:hypothetical protein